MDSDPLAHQLKTTANFGTRSRVLTWLCGGLNHQIEHHLFPNICHVHHRKLAPIVKKTAQEFGLPYYSQVSFWTALQVHTRMLKTLGKPA
jgi:linoleoyl-CoA desaturase